MQQLMKSRRALAALTFAAGALVAACAGSSGGPRTPPTIDARSAEPSVSAPASGGADDPVDRLPQFAGAEGDSAIGLVPPPLSGPSLLGDGTVTVTPGEDGRPTMVVFAAHWCPHCNAELPRIVSLYERGGVPERVRLVVVSSEAHEGTVNYPPDEWLAQDIRWPAELESIDDDATDAKLAESWGLTGFPYFVALDGDGKVVLRWAGELGDESLARVFAQLGEL